MLEPYFPPVVTECVRLHVAAKRYLCAKNPAYFGELSEASIHSLSLQGGPMYTEEIAVFEESPFYQQAVMVRKWDDEGKVAGMKTKTFDDYAPLIQKVVNSRPE